MGLGPPQLLKVTSHTYLALGHEELLWHLEDHAHDGWFLQSMSMYGPPDAPLYAAVFLPLPDDGKPPIEQRIDGPMAAGWSPQAAIEARANEFYRPTIVGMTAWGPHSAVTLVFARQLEPVFRRVGPRKFAYPLPPPSRISIGSFFDLSDANIAGAYHQGDRQRLTLVSAAATAGTDTTAPLFATVWSKFDTRTSWNLLWVDAPYGEGINPQWRSDWRAKSIERGWARFVSVMPVRGQDGPRGLLLFVQGDSTEPFTTMDPDQFTGGVSVYGPKSRWAADNFIRGIEGRWPLNVAACGTTAENALFTFVHSKVGTYGAAPREFHANSLGKIVLKNVPDPDADHASTQSPGWGVVAAKKGSEDDPMAALMDFVESQPSAQVRRAVPHHKHRSTGGLTDHFDPSDEIGDNDPVPQPIDDRPISLGGAIAELESWMLKEVMRPHLGRIAQLAIVRNGELKIALACTYAEAGYQRARHDHLVRIGSVSKPLTALGVLAHMDETQVRTPLAELFAITPELPENGLLSVLSPCELLYHRSGWGTSTPSATQPASSITREHVELALGKNQWLAGCFRRYLDVAKEPLCYTTVPGAKPFASALYNNWNFIGLGEILSGVAAEQHTGVQDWSSYEGTMLAWLAPILSEPTPHLLARGYTLATSRGDAPAHARLPGIAYQVVYSPGSESTSTYAPDLVNSNLYAFDGAVEGGAAAWAMSAIHVARIVSQLDPNAAVVSPAPDLARVAIDYSIPFSLSGQPTPPPKPQTGPYRGFGRFGTKYSFVTPAGTIEATVMGHNGEWEGGCALVAHAFSPDSGSPSLTVALTMNQTAGLSNGLFAGAFRILQRLENSGGWNEGDIGPP